MTRFPEDLANFIVRAKIAAYASSGEGGERRLEDRGKELIYSEGDLRYRDTHYGYSRFIGEEVVWLAGDPIWSLNYYGGLLADACADPKKLYDFLRRAMRRISPERPYRGPASYSEAEYAYSDRHTGSLEAFHGEESILFLGKRVYELRYHGGAVVSRAAQG